MGRVWRPRGFAAVGLLLLEVHIPTETRAAPGPGNRRIGDGRVKLDVVSGTVAFHNGGY